MHKSTLKFPYHLVKKWDKAQLAFYHHYSADIHRIHPIQKQMRNIGLQKLFKYLKLIKEVPKINGFYQIPKNQAIKWESELFSYDFHCHTTFSDGSGSFQEILKRIGKNKHINGLAFTDHPWEKISSTGMKEKRKPNENVIKNSYKIAELAKQMKEQGQLSANFVTFPGSCEFAVKHSPEHPKLGVEVVVLGVPKTFIEDGGGLQKLRRMFTADFIEKVHENNGIAIIPHPYYFTRAWSLLTKENSINLSNPLRLADGYEEINHTIGFVNDKSIEKLLSKFFFYKDVQNLPKIFGYFNWMARMVKNLSNEYPIAQKMIRVGSSDAHVAPFVGAACTLTKKPIENLEDLRQLFASNYPKFAETNQPTLPTVNPRWQTTINPQDVYSAIWEKEGKEIYHTVLKLRKTPGLFNIISRLLKILV
jgi:PHP-associated